MLSGWRRGFALALILGGVVIPTGQVWADGPTSCEGIDNCAAVNSDADLHDFFTVDDGKFVRDGAATLIIGSDFTMAQDYYIKDSNLDIYFGSHTITANDCSFLFFEK